MPARPSEAACDRSSGRDTQVILCEPTLPDHVLDSSVVLKEEGFFPCIVSCQCHEQCGKWQTPRAENFRGGIAGGERLDRF